MGRAPCCDKANVKKGPWSVEEDATLKSYIEQFGTGGNWIALPQKIGLKRCGKSCRLRWLNYLRPNIKHGGFSEEEDDLICKLYISIGSRWSIIAAQLPGRTDNDIKNYWNTRLKKKLLGKRKQSYANRLSVNDQDSREGKTGIEGILALSNSAMERLQLHMHLQRLQNNPLSFYNNSTLWPKLQNILQNNDQGPNLNPLMQQHLLPTDPQTSSITLAREKYEGNEFGNNTQINHYLMLNADDTELSNVKTDSNSKQKIFSYTPILTTTQFHSETVGSDQHQAPCSQLAELDAILNGKTTGCTTTLAPDTEQIAEFDCFKEMNGSSSKDNLIWWSNEFENAKSTSSNSWDSMSTCVPQHVGMMLQDYHELGYNYNL